MYKYLQNRRIIIAAEKLVKTEKIEFVCAILIFLVVHSWPDGIGMTNLSQK